MQPVHRLAQEGSTVLNSNGSRPMEHASPGSRLQAPGASRSIRTGPPPKTEHKPQYNSGNCREVPDGRRLSGRKARHALWEEAEKENVKAKQEQALQNVPSSVCCKP
jgi:hypothetical protein